MSGAHLLESYAELDSPVHRLAASLKLAVTLALVTALAFVPVHYAPWAALLVVAMLLLARVARVPLSVFLVRIAIVQPFVLGVAVLALFQGGGLSVFVAMAVKSTVSVAAVQLLAHTTAFNDLLDVLRRARVPNALVHVLALLHRYLFVVIDESQRMRRARATRTFHASRLATWRTLASVIAVSFVRSVSRAERIAAAMRARGGS